MCTMQQSRCWVPVGETCRQRVPLTGLQLGCEGRVRHHGLPHSTGTQSSRRHVKVLVIRCAVTCGVCSYGITIPSRGTCTCTGAKAPYRTLRTRSHEGKHATAHMHIGHTRTATRTCDTHTGARRCGCVTVPRTRRQTPGGCTQRGPQRSRPHPLAPAAGRRTRAGSATPPAEPSPGSCPECQ